MDNEKIRKMMEGRTEAFRWAWKPDDNIKTGSDWRDTTGIGNHDAAHLYLVETFNKLVLHEHFGLTVDGEPESVTEEDGGGITAGYRPTPIGYLAQAVACGMFHMVLRAVPAMAVAAAMDGEHLSSFFLDTVSVGIKLGIAMERGELQDWHERFSKLKGIEWVVSEDDNEGDNTESS